MPSHWSTTQSQQRHKAGLHGERTPCRPALGGGLVAELAQLLAHGRLFAVQPRRQEGTDGRQRTGARQHHPQAPQGQDGGLRCAQVGQTGVDGPGPFGHTGVARHRFPPRMHGVYSFPYNALGRSVLPLFICCRTPLTQKPTQKAHSPSPWAVRSINRLLSSVQGISRRGRSNSRGWPKPSVHPPPCQSAVSKQTSPCPAVITAVQRAPSNPAGALYYGRCPLWHLKLRRCGLGNFRWRAGHLAETQPSESSPLQVRAARLRLFCHPSRPTAEHSYPRWGRNRSHRGQCSDVRLCPQNQTLYYCDQI